MRDSDLIGRCKYGTGCFIVYYLALEKHSTAFQTYVLDFMIFLTVYCTFGQKWEECLTNERTEIG